MSKTAKSVISCLAVVLIFICLVGFLGFASKGFKNWDTKTWFHKEQTSAVTDAYNNGYTEGVNSQKDKVDSAYADGKDAGIAQSKQINVGDYIDGLFYNPKATFNLNAFDWSKPDRKFTTSSDHFLVGTNGITEIDFIYLVTSFALPTNPADYKTNVDFYDLADIQYCVQRYTVNNEYGYMLVQNGSHAVALSGSSAVLNAVLRTSLTGNDVSCFFNASYENGAKDMLDNHECGIVAYVNPNVEIWGNWISKNPFSK